MDILYTVDEKYLQAVEELRYGELPKALHLFQEIINIDAEYARAYFQIGYIYQYDFKNYRSAGYYYKRCVDLEPEFPDVYEHYLKIATTLNMPKLVHQLSEKALTVPGVCKVAVFECLGLYAEEHQKLEEAANYYKKAGIATSTDNSHAQIKEHLKRIDDKQSMYKRLVYAYQG
jgi:Tfp pilus assembly protein PilF